MANCNPTATPAETNPKWVSSYEGEAVDSTLFKQLVGSLRYLCNSRPDICYAVGLINRFMHKPKQVHMTAAKRVLRYLKGTQNFGVLFTNEAKQEEGELIGNSDSDWCTTGYIFKFSGVKKQSVVVLSSCEAEYIAGAYVACLVIWLNSLLKEIRVEAPNRQQVCHQLGQKPSLTWKKQTHRSKVSFSESR